MPFCLLKRLITEETDYKKYMIINYIYKTASKILLIFMTGKDGTIWFCDPPPNTAHLHYTITLPLNKVTLLPAKIIKEPADTFSSTYTLTLQANLKVLQIL